MRLINARTLKLEEFHDVETRPDYAILSHRWVAGEEVSFQDMQRGDRRMGAGWSKIQFCCRKASEGGYEYAWVDTCCIDKTSSAELSEAINSMFDWYSAAGECYAYLMDVGVSGHSSYESMVSAILRSMWFTRAWTLQELIAPRSVVFFDKYFRWLETKTGLGEHVERYTKIPIEVLRVLSHAYTCPVALRMSWAASRKASRLQDIAYSLFGLFEVNLPLLYGEGKRAYVRLQEEIIRQTHDHSIFAWNSRPHGHIPLFALSPGDFESSGNISLFYEDISTTPYAMTNMGLSIKLRTSPFIFSHACGAPELPFEFIRSPLCHLPRPRGPQKIEMAPSSGARSSANTPTQYQFQEQKIYIVDPSPDLAYPTDTLHGVLIDAIQFLSYGRGTRRSYTVVAHNDWDDEGLEGSRWLEGSLECSGRRGKLQLTEGMLGMVLFDDLVRGVRAIKFAYDLNFRPVVVLATHKARLDPHIACQFQERSYCSIEEYRSRILDSAPMSRFWTVGLNQSDTTSYEDNGDGSFAIEEGVHGFVGGSKTHPSRWIFKAYENKPWHIELAFALHRKTYETY